LKAVGGDCIILKNWHPRLRTMRLLVWHVS
jgi:hypothetical protein